MELEIFLKPSIVDRSEYNRFQLGSKVIDFQEIDYNTLQTGAIALLGVQDKDEKFREQKEIGADLIRRQLFSLNDNGLKNVTVLDFGNIHKGESLKDTEFAVSEVVQNLVKKGIVPILLGATSGIQYGVFKGFEKLEQLVNIVSVDARMGFDLNNQNIEYSDWLSRIVLHQPNYLFNFSNLGYQSYFVSEEEKEVIDKMYFEAHRLGNVRANMEEVEPVVRNADIVGLSLRAVRNSDAPVCMPASPNGLYGEEACIIARYAGMSDKLSCFGIYDYDQVLDDRLAAAALSAQIIWYFMDGFSARKKDYPVGSKKGYLKYTIPYEGPDNDLIFYKSPKSDRWWMNITYETGKNERYQRHLMIPCSYSEYESACHGEIPEKWIQVMDKLQSGII